MSQAEYASEHGFLIVVLPDNCVLYQCVDTLSVFQFGGENALVVDLQCGVCTEYGLCCWIGIGDLVACVDQHQADDQLIKHGVRCVFMRAQAGKLTVNVKGALEVFAQHAQLYKFII